MSQCNDILIQLTGYVLIIGNVNTVHSATVIAKKHLKGSQKK